MANFQGQELLVYVENEREEKWLKHYSSFHRILLVAEGDFSFSLSLAMSFGSATNIVASSLDSYELVVQKYKKAKSNLDILRRLGASILFGVDATTMKCHCDLRMQKFDRIIYNFPHAGFYGKEDGMRLISKHRTLVHHFFRNASGMLRGYGEIHVNHKTTPPFCHWNLEELAMRNNLELIEFVDFKKEDYPGYNNKRGSGPRCDEPFPLGKCSTFKFRFSPKKITQVGINLNSLTHYRNNQESTLIPTFMQPHPNSFELMRDPVLPVHGYVGPVSMQSHPNSFEPMRDPIVPVHGSVGPVSMQSHPNSFELIRTPVVPVHGYVGPVVPPPTSMQSHSNSVELMRAPVPASIQNEEILASVNDVRGECSRIFSGYFNHVLESFGQTDYDVGYFALEALKFSFKMYMGEAPGRSLTGYINLLQELYNLSILRSAWLKRMLLDPDSHL